MTRVDIHKDTFYTHIHRHTHVGEYLRDLREREATQGEDVDLEKTKGRGGNVEAGGGLALSLKNKKMKRLTSRGWRTARTKD